MQRPVDAVALLVLTDRAHACVGEAGHDDDKVDELVDTPRRYARTR